MIPLRIWFLMLCLSWPVLACKFDLLMDVIRNYEPAFKYRVVHFFCSNSESIKMTKHLWQAEYYSARVTTEFPVLHVANSVIYVIDLSCEESNELLSKADKNKLFASPYRWIFLNPQDELPNVDPLVDSDVIVINDTNTVLKMYKRKLNHENVFEKYGEWNKENGLVLVEGFEKDAAVRRRNLKKTILNNCLVITHNSTFSHLIDKREKHLDTIAKVNYVFMEHLSDMLNVRMNYSVEPTWGYVDNNSVWSGMIGELTKNKADIGGTPLFLTTNRIPIIDYIAMTTPTKSKFVFRQPKLSYITNVFTLPFNTNVWVSSIALVVVTAIVLYFIIKWEWYKKRVYGINDDEKHETDTELQDSFQDVALMAYSAVCQQGSSSVPYSSTGRIITILMYTSLMFLYTSYSANIVALLQSSSTSIQTLGDLLNSRLQVGVDDTVFNHFYFPNASEPVRRALYLQKVAPPGQPERFFPIEEGVRRLRQGLFAFHMETGAGYKIVVETFLEDEKCDLQEIQFLQVPDPWLAIQKNSSYKEMLKIGLKKIHESGIQSREVSMLYTKKPPCISRGSSFIGVSIVDCYPAAVVLAGGAGAAVIIFIMEILYHKIVIFSNSGRFV